MRAIDWLMSEAKLFVLCRRFGDVQIAQCPLERDGPSNCIIKSDTALAK